MRGSAVPQLLVTDRGGLGDRSLGASRSVSGPNRERELFSRLLEFRVTYEVEPTLVTPGRVHIDASD